MPSHISLHRIAKLGAVGTLIAAEALCLLNLSQLTRTSTQHHLVPLFDHNHWWIESLVAHPSILRRYSSIHGVYVVKGPRVRELNAGVRSTEPKLRDFLHGDASPTLLRFSDITEVYPQGWYGCASSNGRTVPKVVRK